jgi:tRNA splicing endonuclease
MALHILEAAIIAGLLAYIIYLHVQLSKKNVFIETTIKKLSGIEKTRSMEEIMDLLREINKAGLNHPPDKFQDDRTTNFILENDERLKIYMHYTRFEADAGNILKVGFRFVNSFYKTALPVTRDKLDMIIKHNSQKYYGHYMVIISISNETVSRFSAEIKKAGLKNVSFENIITEEPPLRNENAEPVYILPNRFIKGYINHLTGEITRNPDYDPAYISPAFEKNLLTLK